MSVSKRAVARRFALPVLAPTLALMLAACGGGMEGMDHSGDGAGSPSAALPGNVNAADVTFAQGMIPHHRQAIEMAEDADSKASDSKVKELAAKVEVAQAPEIKQLSGWLSAWGKPVPSGAADHSGHEMPGMMSAADMQQLKRANGSEFDAMFLRMMIDHHNGAITMAKDEQAKGKNPGAKALAKRIETSQAAEITQMKQMLDG